MNEQPKTPRGPHRLTLRDLAAHAGVSRATVSLVLAKSPLVAAKTRARVLESARVLGYVYNRGAANLRTRRTNTIGVSINELTNPYFMVLASAIQKAFQALGRTVFLADSEESTVSQDQFIGTMREYNADGLALCPAQGTDAAALSRLTAQGLACVLVSRDVPGSGLDYVGHENARGMFEATEHLVRLGHRHIAMIGGTELTSTGMERRRGYCEALLANGIAINPELIVPGAPPSRVLGVETIRSLLARDPAPTAAVCFNDVIAFGVMLGLRQMGREPGRDFAVVGFDDLLEAALWTPGLTSVTLDSHAVGTTAARLLLERIEDPDLAPRKVVLQPRLIIRDSSCPPRV